MSNWITVEDSLKGRAIAVQREQDRIVKILETELARHRKGSSGHATVEQLLNQVLESQNES